MLPPPHHILSLREDVFFLFLVILLSDIFPFPPGTDFPIYSFQNVILVWLLFTLAEYSLYILQNAALRTTQNGMIWENSIETCALPYVKQMTSASSTRETRHPTPVLWDNPEGWGWGGGGSPAGDGRDTCTCGRFMLMYSKKPSQYCKVINYPIKVINWKQLFKKYWDFT